MADTFFGFDASVNNGDHLLPPDDDDCVENEEEEYDALNDETFGTLEDTSCLEDWERQHEQYAEYAASSKQSERIEDSISRLVFDDDTDGRPEPISSLSKNNVWAYTPPNRNGDLNTSLILSSLEKASKSFIETRIEPNSRIEPPRGFAPLPPPHHNLLEQNLKQFCTVEELEKNLIKNSNAKHVPGPNNNKPIGPGGPHGHNPYQHHPLFPMMGPPHGRLPPGLPPLGMRPPQPHNPTFRPMGNHPPMPPGLMHHMMPFMPPRGPPGLMYPPHHNNAQFPVNHPYNFPPPYQQQQQRNMPPQMMNNNRMPMGMPPQMAQQNQGRVRNDSYTRSNRRSSENDDYAGLMTNREKQWLLNIQMLQLNTGTPYFDDYYYTVFKERKSKINSDNYLNNGRFPMNNNNNNNKRNGQQQQDGSTLTPKIYTPLQFENSLGKLQCGSVTAPRKIIDMDIVTPDKDSEGGPAVIVRDTRKTKQLLLELEVMYSLLLKAEDLRNPLAIGNLEKLREIKQKQRLRELELAPTPEQKQEVLRLLKSDSEPVVENQHDYIVRLANGFVQEEKFASFLNIRKGKMLLLRLLPHLTPDMFGAHLLDLWSRVLLSISIIGRRDTSGDHILPKLHPFFKRFIQTCTMADILDLVTGLIEVARLENSRSTPLSHQGKTPLYFVLLNKFGVSALVTLLIRSEYLISSDSASEKQLNDWSNFLVSWMELTKSLGAVRGKVAVPIESIPLQILEKHFVRFKDFISQNQVSDFQRFFVDLSL